MRKNIMVVCSRRAAERQGGSLLTAEHVCLMGRCGGRYVVALECDSRLDSEIRYRCCFADLWCNRTWILS